MNYTGVSRTNYFHVTDMDKFNILAEGLSGEFIEITHKDTDETMFCILADDTMSYHAPASAHPEDWDYEDHIYDVDGNEIDKAKVDEYAQIYDADGECIFDRKEGDDEWDKFTEELIKIIPEDECFVYMESGHEGHRYISGFAQVITHNGSKSVNLSTFVEDSVKELLGDDAQTSYTY